MKLTGLFIAVISLFLAGACNQQSEDVADAANEVAVGAQTGANVAEKAAETADDTVEAFATGALIDPNTASADVIAAIPGIDAELAQLIVSTRPYATPSALHAVLKDVVDESSLRSIYSAMFVKVDLNTGSNADYQLIPSSLKPGHLAHEFEEYRPYSSIEQFGREMSKYVSAEEVAFLQRYVVIN